MEYQDNDGNALDGDDIADVARYLMGENTFKNIHALLDIYFEQDELGDYSLKDIFSEREESSFSIGDQNELSLVTFGTRNFNLLAESWDIEKLSKKNKRVFALLYNTEMVA